MKTILLLLVIFSLKLHAHPVIYKDGFAISSFNMSQISNNYVMYSFKQNWSLGLDHWRFTRNNDNNELGFLKLNHLLWRKNTENSQANIYLHTGFGVEDQEIQSRQTRATFMGGVEADWEPVFFTLRQNIISFRIPT
jgi:hypothetical protein